MLADRNCCTRCDSFKLGPWEMLQPLIDLKLTSLQWKLCSRIQLSKYWNSSKKQGIMENVPLICQRHSWVQAFSMFKMRRCPRPKLLRLQTMCKFKQPSIYTVSLFHRQANWKFIETCDRRARWGFNTAKRWLPCSKTLNQTSAERFWAMASLTAESKGIRCGISSPTLISEEKSRSNHDLCCAAGNSRPKIPTGI